MSLRSGLLALCIIASPLLAQAQTAQVAFGGLKQDTSLPVEVTSDELSVDQAAGTAVFSGSVIVGQGQMRLSADRVDVSYDTATGGTGEISEMVASGNVVLVNGGEAAESQKAVYAVNDGTIVMTGSVLLTQGQNALSGEKLIIDLKTGAGTMQGRVKTIFQTGGKK